MPSTRTPEAVDVRPVSGRADLEAFLALPERLFRDHPDFVTPLRMDVKDRLSKKHPYFEHAKAETWLARRDGRVVGRIGATVNLLHNETHGERTGFFGFFECEDDPIVAARLFDTAAAWLRERGMDRVRGPASWSSNDEFGLYVGGDPGPPTFLMPWNPPWYVPLVEGAGFVKAMDLLAWHMWADRADLPRWERLAGKIAEREGLVLRPIDMRRFKADVEHIRDLYADAWSRNWGFVPMTRAEFDLMATQMKMVLIPSWCIFVEKDGRPIGFALALPDMNQVIRGLGGRLLPFGWLKLLLGKHRCTSSRVITMGVRKEFQGRGIDSILYHGITKAITTAGVGHGELGWVLETNAAMNNALERAGGRVSRTYRVYERPL